MALDCLESMDSVDNHMVIDLAIMEVIKANNTRFGEGCYKNKDGKFIRSPEYKQPDLAWIVELYNVSFPTPQTNEYSLESSIDNEGNIKLHRS